MSNSCKQANNKALFCPLLAPTNTMSLDSLLQDDKLKFCFVGGKGGVGKTTTSSAVATLFCRHGRRVLLVSTDPAHSLSDAWQPSKSFSNTPTRVELSSGDKDSNQPCVGSLHVMEIDPQQSIAKELQHWTAVSQEFLNTNNKGSSLTTNNNEWKDRLQQFQTWLASLPGVDEATALAAAVQHVESGRYDVIVFDTAPTGHTLKLLALPAVLQQGIAQLQSWQATFWGYWQVLKAAATGGSATTTVTSLQQQVTTKLTQYQADIQKVASMLQDAQRTRFVAVCLAEHLSVAETQRLLQELQRHGVVASHVVVNQLVTQHALTEEQLAQLESLAEVGSLSLPTELLRKTVHACRLTAARKAMQQKYLTRLRAETQGVTICQVPLLAHEVTGATAIQEFAQLLILGEANRPINNAGPSLTTNNGTKPMPSSHNPSSKSEAPAIVAHEFAPGDVVQVVGLTKSPQFNHLEGRVTRRQNAETGRFEVTVAYNGQDKTLALRPDNLVLVRKAQKKQKTDKQCHSPTSSASASLDSPAKPFQSDPNQGLINKAMRILEDPEIKQLVESNPRFMAAVQDCLANPMNVMKYLGDAEMSPLISKALSKM